MFTNRLSIFTGTTTTITTENEDGKVFVLKTSRDCNVSIYAIGL